MNSFGLDELNTSRLMSILESHSCISKAVIFGSRARNTFKVTSDIDIAIWTDLNSESLSLSSNVISSLKADFEDSLIPYTVDLIDYQQLSNQRLKEEIDCYGKVFYLRGWVETSLGEVCEKIGSGSTPRGGNEVYKNKGISLIRSQNVLDFDFSYNGLAFIDDIQASLLNNVTVLSGDILINITGDSVARVCMVPERVLPARVNQHVSILRTIKESLLPEFLKYYLLNPVFKNYLLILANSGGTRNALTKGILENLKIFLPPLSEQKAIAAVLSSLDDKIELLREQNKILEEMGQTIFEEWFGTNTDIKKQRLGDWVEVKRGGSPRPIQDYISETGYRWLKISDASATSSPFIFDIKECIRKEGLNKTVLLKAGSIVLSNSATPGIPKILAVDSCIHDGWLYFPRSRFSNEFLYLLFQKIRPQLIQQGSGSVFTNLKTDILKDYEAPLPSDEILQKFDHTIKPIFEKIYDNANQIQSLAHTCNELLPRLMRGEIRVNDLHNS
jgi:type I restriction enzyme S subunit